MLSVQSTLNVSPPGLSLSGIIDETTDFSRIFDVKAKDLNLYCKEVSRINSLGIRHWCEYFKGARKSGCRLAFYELSPILVNTTNYVPEFIEKAEIQSICLPYHCTNCRSLSLFTETVETLVKKTTDFEEKTCPVCQKKANLDEVLEEYLSFLDT